MYLDTANLKHIADAMETGILKGVTTNPTILHKEGKPRAEQLKAIDALGVPLLYVQLVGDTVEEMLDDYEELKGLEKELSCELGIKIPITYVGLKTIKKVKELEPERKILGTAVYSSDQVILGALAGCDCVAPYYNRMQNNATDPDREIEKMRLFIDDRGLETKILAASFKNSSQVVNALVSGAHTCTVDYGVFRQMVDKDVALKAVDVFNRDGRALPR